MRFTEHSYSVAPALIVGLLYGDLSPLDDDDAKALNTFLDRLPAGPGHWSAPDDTDADVFEGRCSITGKRGPLARVSWFTAPVDNDD